MNIYMLTFHGSVNYGAVFQAVALYKTLSKIENNCTIVDYNRITHHKNWLGIRWTRNFKLLLSRLLCLPGRIADHIHFNRFLFKNARMTPKSFDGVGALNAQDFP